MLSRSANFPLQGAVERDTAIRTHSREVTKGRARSGLVTSQISIGLGRECPIALSTAEGNAKVHGATEIFENTGTGQLEVASSGRFQEP